MLKFTHLVTSAFLLVLLFTPASAIGQDKQIVVTNKTGKDLPYMYRAIYNDGKGSDKTFIRLTQKAGGAANLKSPGVEDGHGVIVWLRPDLSENGYKLYPSEGPYEIRTAAHPFNPNDTVLEIYDGKGKRLAAAGGKN